mgnify:CR=1 FL=1
MSELLTTQSYLDIRAFEIRIPCECCLNEKDKVRSIWEVELLYSCIIDIKLLNSSLQKSSL